MCFHSSNVSFIAGEKALETKTEDIVFPYSLSVRVLLTDKATTFKMQGLEGWAYMRTVAGEKAQFNSTKAASTSRVQFLELVPFGVGIVIDATRDKKINKLQMIIWKPQEMN